MTITFSILDGFSKFFHCWKEKQIYNKTHIILATIPSVCRRTTLRNLRVWICGNFQKKQSKNLVTFDKNRNVSCHIAEYYHNSCSKCPPFVRTHARRRLRHSSIVRSSVNDGLVSAMPNMQKTLLQFTILVYIKIVCYLQRVFNEYRKLKQQVSK